YGRLDQPGAGPVVELPIGDAGGAARRGAAESGILRERRDIVGEQQTLVAGLCRCVSGGCGVVAWLDHPKCLPMLVWGKTTATELHPCTFGSFSQGKGETFPMQRPSPLPGVLRPHQASAASGVRAG